MSTSDRVVYEPWTPIQVESKLAELFNQVAHAEIAMRKLREAETEAEWDYERAQTIAAFDPNCPIPVRGGSTVGEREAFIKGMCDDELKGLLYHRLNMANQKGYMMRLEQQISIVQTMAKFVLQAYQMPGSSAR